MQNDEIFWASPDDNGGWTVKRFYSGKNCLVHATKAEAWREARRLALGSGTRAVLVGKDGQIKTSNTYEEEC